MGLDTQKKLDKLACLYPDQHARDRAGEVSVDRAAIEEGIAKSPITLPRAPDAAVRVIVKHFQGEALTELILGLANRAGLELVDASGEIITATGRARRRAGRGRDHAPRRGVG